MRTGKGGRACHSQTVVTIPNSVHPAEANLEPTTILMLIMPGDARGI